ncbi:nose resistant to fluoxetine protein 6-like isoform X2 [Periplaneta americana]|uniref:nose resistant to fluoxetine protein 6-like isoform X2 n=1 Tax=Periplaneta americana TaxID=6978 RepID=UPI0037E72E33
MYVVVLVICGLLHESLFNQALASPTGYGDFHFERLMNAMEKMPTSISAWPKSELCQTHIRFYNESLNAGKPWAYKMFDSNARLPAGLLMGNLVFFGNYDECVDVVDIHTDMAPPFSGKYCLVTLTWINDTFIFPNEQFDDIRLLGSPRTLSLRWGFCIPSTCGAQDLVAGLQEYFGQDVVVTLTDQDCHTKDEKIYTSLDCVAIAVFSAFGIVVVLSTAYDIMNKGDRRELLMSFSLRRHGSKLLSADTSRDSMPVLHGVRFLSMFWIVLGHRYVISTTGPAINTVFTNSWVRSWENMPLVNFVMAVDTFLLLSGLLVAYVFLKQMRRPDARFNIPLHYLHRYIRLTPVMAALVLIQLSLMEHLGSGPMWSTNEFLTELCRKNWWATLLYIQNYYCGDQMCLGHSWYLSVDMQLFWLSPIFLYPLLRWPRKYSMSLLAVATIAGLLGTFVVSYVLELPTSIDSGVGPEYQAWNKYLYVKTHTRCAPWFIGLGLGYLLHHTRNRNLRLTKLQISAGWLLTAVALLGSLFGLLPFQQPDYAFNNLETSIYSGLHRPVWTLGVAWLIFACVSGYGGPVNSFLSWKGFHPFSRLSYCIYLVHYLFLMGRQMTIRTPVYLSHMDLVTQFFGEMVFTIILAAILSLVFESPFIVIERLIFSRPKDGKGKTTVATNIPENQSAEKGNVNQAFTIDVTDKPSPQSG